MMVALGKAGYLEPTPIQAGLIPRALTGVDVLGQARTGTGKTAAFVIPILERVEPGKKSQGPQALILVPTRELAVQVREEVVKLAHGRKIHSVAVYGGKPIRGQIEKLSRGAEVVIGTPGRVLDHMGRGTLTFNDLRIVVLDEADRMLDIGFRPDIEKILRRCPRSRQTLLLSATVPPPVERLARSYMNEPESQNFSPTDISVHTIEQFYCTVDGDRKFDLLEHLLKREEPQQAIVFCRTKRGTDKVERRLTKRFKDVACIHGDLAQSARDRAMAAFREGKVKILVATDVVGRGIDVSGISHIFKLRYSAVLRRLRAPRGPHRTHGPRGRCLHVCHARRGQRTDADRNANRQAAGSRRGTGLCHGASRIERRSPSGHRRRHHAWQPNPSPSRRNLRHRCWAAAAARRSASGVPCSWAL